MATPLRVLFIEDSDDDTTLQVRLLRQGGYEVSYERVETPDALSAALEKKWDIIISDYSMPHFKGTDALKFVRQKGQDVPFIFVSGTIGEDTTRSGTENRCARLFDEDKFESSHSIRPAGTAGIRGTTRA